MSFEYLLLIFITYLMFSMLYSNIKTLMLLMLLELVVLSSLVFMLNLTFLSNENMTFYFLVFLTVAACEAALGLSLMITMIRMNGSDYFNFLISYCKNYVN
uniref:NADH dehydrogenase subunit 4L n=1 Tax=Arion vulgaris TaxID=1028688 RepID=A0A6C0AAB9_9EUPU|nr:NADH dehydrogenase subunit 4L [Arion vulgaris]QHS71051.1 NADH dehydrogenase subunit 4L [Arion vulgaris]